MSGPHRRENPEGHHRQHRNRDGSADGKTCHEAQVGVGGSKNDAQDDPGNDRFPGELGEVLAVRQRDEGFPGLEFVSGGREFSRAVGSMLGAHGPLRDWVTGPADGFLQGHEIR